MFCLLYFGIVPIFTGQVGRTVALLTFIREVLSSNLGRWFFSVIPQEQPG
jgi:hypothetical protein